MNEQYILNDNKKIVFLKNYELLVDARKPMRIKLESEEYKKLMLLSSKYSIFTSDVVSKKTFKLLYKNKVIIKANSNIIYSYKTIIERNELFAFNYLKNNSFRKIKDPNILIIGAGGISCVIIDQLLAVGINKYSIIDFDTVDISNLNRQFIYKKNDIGKYKVDVFKDYILLKDEEARVKCYKEKVESNFQLERIIKNDNIDFIIGAADIPPCILKRNIIQASITTNKPCIFGGVGIYDGSYGPLLVDKKRKVKLRNELDDIINEINCFYPCKSSFGVTNSIIGSYMSWDIIMYLLGEKKKIKSIDKEVVINFGGSND